mgnify:CR=1 FL=1
MGDNVSVFAEIDRMKAAFDADLSATKNAVHAGGGGIRAR